MKTASTTPAPLIKPTVGRVVWFYPGELAFRGFNYDPAVPMAAIIAFVQSDRMVNLHVFDHAGAPHGVTSIPLHHGDEVAGDGGPRCEWMPFQRGQAQAQAEQKKPDAVPAAFEALKAELQADPEYAWAWHCNFAKPFMDSTTLGHELANNSAASIMRHVFDIDITTHPHYRDLRAKWDAENVAQAASPVPSYGPQEGVSAAGWIMGVRAQSAADRRSTGFGAALGVLKRGGRVAREGWNGRGMFVYMVPAAAYPVQTGAAVAHFGAGSMVPYNAYLALKGVDDTVSTWAPSTSDCLAEDWVTVH